MENFNTTAAAARNTERKATISLRGKTGWSTFGNTLLALAGGTSTGFQIAGHGITKGTEISLGALPTAVGQAIATNAKKKGLSGIKSSLLSNEATKEGIDSIYYGKENFLGRTRAYTDWRDALSNELKDELKYLIDENYTSYDKLEGALKDGGEEAANTMLKEASDAEEIKYLEEQAKAANKS